MKFNPHQWYLNGLKKTELVNNTFIGGVSSTITSASDLASKLEYYPSGLTMNAADIHNFTIVGDNIECYIGVDYRTSSFAFQYNTNITYYYDNSNKCKYLGDRSFNGCTNLENVILEGVITALQIQFRDCVKLKQIIFPNLIALTGGNSHFRDCSNLELVYLPKCTTYGTTTSASDIFTNCKQGLKVYAEPTMETINGGSVEGDLAYVTSTLSGTVVYVDNFTTPNPITDLVVDTVYATALKLSWSAPTSTNTIDYYEIYVNGIYNSRSNTTTGYAVGLTASTNYTITVKTIDIFYNISNSNAVAQTTNATEDYPMGSIISYWKHNNNLLDAVGGNNGIGTDITYTAGKIGNAAVFNGSSSYISVADDDTLSFENKPFSFSFWINPTSIGTNRIIFWKGGGPSNREYRIQQDNNNIFVRLMNPDTNIIETNFNTNLITSQWKHIVITDDGSTNINNLKLYTNGVITSGTQLITGTYTGMVNSTFNLSIGTRSDAPGINLFHGLIDDPLIWGVELTATQAANVYAKQNAGLEL